MIETEKEVDLSFWNSNKPYQDLSTHLGIETLAPFQSRSVVHKLSHRHIYAKFWIVELYGDLENGIAINDIENYPVPRLIDKMIPSLICSEQEM